MCPRSSKAMSQVTVRWGLNWHRNSLSLNVSTLLASKSVWTLPELSSMGLTKVPILSYDHTHASTVHMPSYTLMTVGSSSFQDQCIACECVSVCLSVPERKFNLNLYNNLHVRSPLFFPWWRMENLLPWYFCALWSASVLKPRGVCNRDERVAGLI
jgi:hypothetical protein